MRQLRIRARGATSLRTVAKALGEHHTVVSRWERGKLEMKVTDLMRYAGACGLDPQDIVAGVLPRPAEQLVLGLEPTVGRKVLDLVEELRRRRPRRPGERKSA